MRQGSVKIVDRLSAVEAIKRLGEDDLRFLNQLIVERLKLISQARSTSLMAAFGIGDVVSFHAADGRKIRAVMRRLNKKTVSVYSEDGHRWNVAPGLLHLEKSTEVGMDV